MGVPLVAGGGIGSIILVLAALFFGFDPSVILQTDVASRRPPRRRRRRPAQDDGRDFVAVVLADTEDTWARAVPRDEPRVPESEARAVHAAPSSRRAGWPARRWGRSTARATTRSTSTSTSSATCGRASRRPATSPRPTSSRTRSAITCRACSASPRRWPPRGSAATAPPPTRSRCGRSCRPIASPGVWAHHANRTRQVLEQGDLEEALRRRRGDRRRPPAAADPGPGGAGVLHARQLGPAGALVQARLRRRRRESVRHLPRRAALADGRRSYPGAAPWVPCRARRATGSRP